MVAAVVVVAPAVDGHVAAHDVDDGAVNCVDVDGITALLLMTNDHPMIHHHVHHYHGTVDDESVANHYYCCCCYYLVVAFEVDYRHCRSFRCH